MCAYIHYKYNSGKISYGLLGSCNFVNVIESYKTIVYKKLCTSPGNHLSSCNILVLVIKKYEYCKYDLVTFSCNKLDWFINMSWSFYLLHCMKMFMAILVLWLVSKSIGLFKECRNPLLESIGMWTWFQCILT